MNRQIMITNSKQLQHHDSNANFHNQLIPAMQSTKPSQNQSRSVNRDKQNNFQVVPIQQQQPTLEYSQKMQQFNYSNNNQIQQNNQNNNQNNQYQDKEVIDNYRNQMIQHQKHIDQQIEHHKKQIEYHEQQKKQFALSNSPIPYTPNNQNSQNIPRNQIQNTPNNQSIKNSQQLTLSNQAVPMNVPRNNNQLTLSNQHNVPRNQQLTLSNVPMNVPINPYENLDLDLNNYELEDILRLFSIDKSATLTDEIIKNAKKIILKLHPDKCKSKLDPKFYEFFQKAYKYLVSIYEFQNTSTNRTNRNTTYSSSDMHNEEHEHLLKSYHEKQGGFSIKTFNEQFEKNRVDDELDRGYAEWIKSSDNEIQQPQGRLSKTAMNEYIENEKRKLRLLIPYHGVDDNTYSGSSVGGTMLDLSKVNNYTGSTTGDIFSNRGLTYTDLKQAHTETLIPVSEDDFNKMPKYRNVNEYSAAREAASKSYVVMNDADSKRYFRTKEQEQGMEAASLGLYLAKQAEKVEKVNNAFWSNLQQITYGGENNPSSSSSSSWSIPQLKNY